MSLVLTTKPNRIMNKKLYISPQMSEFKVDMESLLMDGASKYLNSNIDNPDVTVTDGYVDDSEIGSRGFDDWDW